MPKIRKMQAEDWEQFHKMDTELFPEDGMEEDFFRRRVEHDGFFALTEEDQIIGNLIVTRFGKDEAHLGRIGVSKAHQRKGYGSLLMQKAIDWFRNEGGIREAHLYTQDFNRSAQSLYKKFGFKRAGTTWHYYVTYESLEPNEKYICQEIQEEEIDGVGGMFASMPPKAIRRFMEYEDQNVFVLKDGNGKVQGVCRFTPKFPGCFPFEITNVDCFDDFMSGIQKFSLPEYDYCRVTFTDLPELAELCEKREYRLHHRLHKMSLNLD
ncbi:MAG: GNAT family N-acetyltransferase [Candidatus Thorarchaeota archaeon]